MRRVETAIILFGVFFGMGFAQADDNTVGDCNKIAEMCRREADGGTMSHECTRKYDACMNNARCDDVYLSCLELREEDPGVAEHICTTERDKCLAAQMRK